MFGAAKRIGLDGVYCMYLMYEYVVGYLIDLSVCQPVTVCLSLISR
jgi:hypothetical protein